MDKATRRSAAKRDRINVLSDGNRGIAQLCNDFAASESQTLQRGSKSNAKEQVGERRQSVQSSTSGRNDGNRRVDQVKVKRKPGRARKNQARQNCAARREQQQLYPEKDWTGEKALWIAVIQRAIYDARGQLITEDLQNGQDSRDRVKATAKKWLASKSKLIAELMWIAEILDLTPQFVRRIIEHCEAA